MGTGRRYIVAGILAVATMLVAASGVINVRAALGVVVVGALVWRIAARASEWRR